MILALAEAARRSFGRQFAVLASILVLLASAGVARADFNEEFSGGSLAQPWTALDGYAGHYPSDVANHAHFQVSGSRLSISFPGANEHNQWWFDHAQVTRPFLGDGVYEIKVDSALTGSQQFGITFESAPSQFMHFMLYSTDQIYAYVERFANVSGTQYKTTVSGKALGLGVPTAGPYYLRVTLQGHANPATRTWKFDWSRDGAAWDEVDSGSLETAVPGENAGSIQRVGVFAGNQPPGFDGFDAGFDYFRYTSPAPVPTPAPNDVVVRGGNHQVEVWWSAVSDADSYGVYRATTDGGPYTLLDTITQTSFTDLTAVNGTRYYYAVTAFDAAVESAKSTAVSTVPHSLADMAAVPTSGLKVALSGSELAYQLSNNQSVAHWANAKGPQMAAAGGTSAPKLISAGINGKPVVRFDGIDDYLTLPAGFDNFTAGMSVFIVARPTVLQSGFKLLALGNGPGQHNVVLGRAGSDSGLQFFTDNGSGNVEWFNTPGGALVAGEAAVFSVVQLPGPAGTLSFAEVAKNGTALAGKNVWVPPTTTRAVNYIGKSFWNEGLFQGDIAEVLLYDRALSAAEEAAVRNYIAQKYGLGGQAPPPPIEAPATVNATAGDSSVALSWTTVTGAIGYRVYRADAPGATLVQFADIASLHWTDGSVVNGTTYRYVVRAYDTTEESVNSEDVLVTPSAPPEPEPEPNIPTAGLILSLDATTTAQTMSAGSPVTVWQDESTSDNDAASGAGAPILVANAINGRAALRFDGVDDYLSLPSGFQNFTAGMSLYIVARPTVLQSGFKLLALGNGPGQHNIVLGRAGSTSGLQYFTDGSSGVQWFNTPDGLVANESALFSLIQGSGAAGALSYAEAGKNGIALGGQNVWVPAVTSRAVNYIGKSYWNEGLFQGDIAEVLLYNRSLSATEQAEVRSYLATKYGLAVN